MDPSEDKVAVTRSLIHKSRTTMHSIY